MYRPIADILPNKALFIVYDREGEAKVASTYFGTKDHTHTLEAGAKLNAAEVVEGIKSLKGFTLNKYLK